MDDPTDSRVAEMRRKVAWAIGSTLGLPYFGERTAPKIFATKMAIAICESYTDGETPTWGNPWDMLPG